MVSTVFGHGLMNILYISQYFPPEIGATQSRAYEMAKNLIEAGHRVTVMTEVPNHPSGIIPSAYRGRLRVDETYDGIPVVRSWVYARPEKTFKTRMQFYLSFMGMTVLNSLFLRSGKFHAVFATSPPLFVGLAGLSIARMRRIPFFFEVRDLWPESAVDLGQLGNQKYIDYGHAIANLCYRKARGIVAVTNGIKERLKQKGIPEGKLFLIKNGTNPERFRYIHDPGLEKKLGWTGKFVVLYAGVHGVAQGLETVLGAAERLVDHPTIHFVFIGEGPVKPRLMARAMSEKLPNVEFLPEVPSDEICRFISLAAVCLVPLKKIPLFQGALPSKIFDCWACGKPLLISVDGEARREVEAAGGGVFVEPENSEALSDAILTLRNSPNKGKEMGENGRRYIYEKGYIRSLQAEKLSRIIEKTAK
jgi:glycosyltransferase involved in cell wall biosynthesis